MLQEKIFEKIWENTSPIFTVGRVLLALIFCLLISDYKENIFTLNVFLLKLDEIWDLFTKALNSLVLWKIIWAVVASALIGPFINSYMNRYYIKEIHYKNSGPLLNNLNVHARKRTIDQGELEDYVANRSKGIRLIECFRVLGEIISLSLLVSLFFEIEFQLIQHFSLLEFCLLIAISIVIWLMALYLVSQKILIAYLSYVAPFNIVRDLLKNEK